MDQEASRQYLDTLETERNCGNCGHRAGDDPMFYRCLRVGGLLCSTVLLDPASEIHCSIQKLTYWHPRPPSFWRRVQSFLGVIFIPARQK
jgi:hypothetical protein